MYTCAVVNACACPHTNVIKIFTLPKWAGNTVMIYGASDPYRSHRGVEDCAVGKGQISHGGG